MHRQAFFSFLVVVVSLCAALSIAAPTKASSPSLSKIPTKPNTPALPAPKEPSKPAKSPKTPTQSSKRPSSTAKPSNSCPAKTTGKASSKKAREAGDPGLESRSPNPVTTVCDVPIREDVDCTGRPSPLENVKRRTNSPGSAEYVPGSSSPEHSSEGEGANVLE
ncbi:hypothetical protein DFH05DRAFT_232750 [Lentinula detonsa]|uniref:Uncharacterized protein n=1 Tax=Lentinula detonsa TaxID=2804962 RepID=A0A9W8NXQ5_9AGAR|nr:hypothetical protein DFH05DRAFT_232750 [Lentinula detonsa]